MEIDKIEDLLINKGLYDKCQIDINDLELLKERLKRSKYNNSKIDCFCINCGQIRTFEYDYNKQDSNDKNPSVRSRTNNKVDNEPTRDELLKPYLNERYTQTYKCTRNNKHKIMFDLITDNNQIIKIGQFPSVADLNKGDAKKYKNILADQYKEYTTSIGLYSHGVGIGSFVYLRRIIENLVYDKYVRYSENINLSHDDFKKLDFKEKIGALEQYLPKNLVANKNIYSIVSKGVHSLSEQECLEMYDGVKLGIQLILDEELAERERKEKEKELEKFVAQKTSEIKVKNK